MREPDLETGLTSLPGRVMEWTRGRLVPALHRHRIFGVALVVILLAMVYWGWVASNRYVSEAHVVIHRIDLAAPGAGNGGLIEQMLLRDYLLSVDMLSKLDAELNLRAHYSDPRHDLLSRLWLADSSQEWFHRYYRSRISVEFDTSAAVLIIKAQAYEPRMAQAITARLVREGERTMNESMHRVAGEQVTFLEKQVAGWNEQALRARQAVVAFQERKGLISPQSTVENLAAVVNKLEAQLTELQARRSGLLGYLAPTAPGIVDLDLQIAAVEKQIDREKSRLVSPSAKTLNRTVEEYQRLLMAAEFAQDVYKTSLVALEKGRVEATRTLLNVLVVQQPTLPQSSEEPRRIYNIVVFILFTLLLAGIVHLLAAIIRDHKD